jgi:hypothetical protein
MLDTTSKLTAVNFAGLRFAQGNVCLTRALPNHLPKAKGGGS